MSREALISAARRMQNLGLNRGTSGNLSLRRGDGILITPSAIPYDELTPDMLPLLRDDGSFEGAWRPSSEWRFHLDIYAARPEVNAIVHNHAPHATALAMARRELPACHYMIARFGGAPIRVAPYALFGTAELSAHAVAALQGRTACLLANHGCITLGATIEAALAAAIELETLAQQYLLSFSAGGPFLLTDQEIDDAVGQFAAVYSPNLPRIAAETPSERPAPGAMDKAPGNVETVRNEQAKTNEPRFAVIVGHRGARGEAPENTIAGFRHAETLGVTAFETDVAVTADFIPVLHHNPDLADGRLIRDLKFSELKGIPMLAEALIGFPGIEWLIEIKTFPAEPYKTHSPAVMVRAVRAALAAAGTNPSRVSILAFDWAVLDEVRIQAPDLNRVALTAPAQLAMRDLWWGGGFEKLTAPQAVAQSGATAWSPQHHSLTPHAIAEARSLGLRIIPWTVNDPAAYARLAPLVDAITTDYPSRFLPALAAQSYDGRQQTPPAAMAG